nr:C25 family cysteine peptidase [Candidatus Sigynarchaeota archaeon]
MFKGHRAARGIIIASILALILISTINQFRDSRETSIGVHEFNSINNGAPPAISSMIHPSNALWKNPRVECLIITRDSLVAAFSPLAALKSRRGVYTEILTVEIIVATREFNASGNDEAAWIRNAIKQYHDNSGTEFIILGGDVNVIPIRYTYNPDGDEPWFNGEYDVYKPTDQYYACLNGTWDEDNDGRFGEMNRDNAHGVDEVDWSAEVYVGRLPANDAPQANILVQKIIDYECNPPAGSWSNTAMFAGAVSQYASPGENKSAVDEAALSEFMIDNYFASMRPKRVYHCSSSYTCPSTFTALTSASLVSTWNQGASLVNLAGHGDPASYGGMTGISSYMNYMTRIEAANLCNNGTLSLAYIYSCSSGAFDVTERGIAPMNSGSSLAETLILNPSGGAIGVVSAMRTSWYKPSDPMFEALNRGQDRFFWREFMIERAWQPGKALYLSKMAYIDQYINKYWYVDLNWDENLAQNTGYTRNQENYRKNLLTYNLLGDPEIVIYTRQPELFAANITGSKGYIGDLMILEVRSASGAIVPNARVLLTGGEYYIIANANEMGIAVVQIPDDISLIGTNMTVMFSGHNMLATSMTITIEQDMVPPESLHVSVPGDSVDFDDPGKIVINASGIDAGSGLRYAFVVVVNDIGDTINIIPMTITAMEGNFTLFSCKYPFLLQPGAAIRFYVAAFDASGNYVLARAGEDQFYVMMVKPRLIEIALNCMVFAGVPTFIVLAIAWLCLTRRKKLLVIKSF